MVGLSRWKARSAGAALAAILATSSCGYILYPERRNGPLSDETDVATVAFDCLWLLVGVIPGVVAIIVDATNDTWLYTQKELNELKAAQGPVRSVRPGSEVVVRVHGRALRDAELALMLVDDQGREIGSGTTIQAVENEPTEPLRVTLPADMPEGLAEIAVELDGRRQVAWTIETVAGSATE